MNKKNSVLIADDSKSNIDALRSILEGKYTVYVALNGDMALKTIERTKPDLVLLDVNMPIVNGFEVLKRMKTMDGCQNIPVIFISGETDAEHQAEGLLLGAGDYIAKPYNPHIVLIKVQNQVQTKMYRDGLEKMVEQATQDISASRQAIIMGMSLLAEGRDQGTGEHLTRMQKYTQILSYKMLDKFPDKITEDEVKDTVLLSPLHDIGKVAIPDAILLKKGKLTDEEFETIKNHTVFGADVLRKTEELIRAEIHILDVAVQIALYHHEKFDGTGYPERIKGYDIPMPARIVALADVYDALTSKRDYKDAFSHEQAMDIILKGDGRTMPGHFDPDVLSCFIDVAEEFRAVQ